MIAPFLNYYDKMNTELFKSSKPLPSIPENATKETIIKTLKKHAIENNFEVVIARSTETLVHLKCVKGGVYRNTRKLTDETRKIKKKNSRRINCPFYIRVGMGKGRINYLKPTSENEHYHNHDITKENLLSPRTGKKKKLDSTDTKSCQHEIEQNTPNEDSAELIK